MDILNFISWIRGGRVVTTVDPTQTLLPVGLKDSKRDDGYLAGAITVSDLAAQVGLPYKVYTALLTQSGTNAPVATILENTLGFVPSWTRTAAGTYKTTNASFQLNKTIVNNLNPWGDGLAMNGNVEPKLAFIAVGPVYVDVRLATNLSSSNTIEINTYNSISGKTDGIISQYAVFLEIRVYP